MKIALVLLMFMGTDSPRVEVIHGFNDIQVCNIAGKKILSNRNKNYNEYYCIIVDNNKIVEKES